MGFFSDLKEDLSQAVSELMPDEEELVQTEVKTGAVSEDVLEEEYETNKKSGAELPTDLEEMLSRIAEMEQENTILSEWEETELVFTEEVPEDNSPEDIRQADEPHEDAGQYEEPLIDTLQADIPQPDTQQDTQPEMLQAEVQQYEIPEADPVQADIPQEDTWQYKAMPEDVVPDEEQQTEHVIFDAPVQEQEEQYEAAQGEGNIQQEEIIKEEILMESVYVAASEVENNNMETNRNILDETAIITSGMTIKGDITADGSMELQGNVEGDIEILGKLNVTGCITGNSQASEIYADNAKVNGEVRSLGSVKIGQSSVIIGNVFASSAVIAGAVKGDIDVHGPVILDTTAIVMGNIKSKSVQINNGAVIEGMCSQCYAEVNPVSFFEDLVKVTK